MDGAASRRQRDWRRLLRFGFAALAAAWVSFASAQAITVSPLRADLSAAETVAVVTVRNDDPRYPTIVQVGPSSWQVVDGADHYQPTRDLAVSPSVFKLEPGQTQVVRLSLRVKADARSERLYRLFLQQVADEAEQSRRAGNVRFLFNVGIPVVVAPVQNPDAAPRVAWRIEGGPAGGYRLRASNEGTAHLKLTGVSLPAATGEVRIVSGPNYLLPGTERAWNFEAGGPLPAGPVRLTVRAEDGTSSVVQADRIE
ncbi:MAG TPA: fimbria/pilus periplasmic chaperone [Burkholderiaceae bacterium]